MEIFVWIAPVFIIICVIMALKGTKTKRVDDCPPWLISNISKMNGPERKWNIK